MNQVETGGTWNTLFGGLHNVGNNCWFNATVQELELLDESARAKLAVERTLFMKKSRIIYDLFRKMNSQNRNECLQYFSLANWKTLPESQKSERHDIEL